MCIITPGQIGSNPRVVKEAQALHEAGLDVTLIATRNLDSIEARDQALMRRIAWRLVRLDVRSRWRWRARRAVQLTLRKAHAAWPSPRLADLAFSAFTPPLLAAALRTRADLYIAHYPAGLPAAAAAARRFGARLAYDAEDFHPGDWPELPRFDTDRALVRAIESRYLPACAHVTAASRGIAEAYAQTYAIERPVVIRNAFPRAQAVPAPTPRGSTAPGPSVYWFSQVVGPNRGLECAVSAIGRARTRPHLYLRGHVAAGFEARLKEIAAQSGAVDRIHLLPPAAPDLMEHLAAAYDIGLASEPAHTRNNDIALSNKLFTYLLAGIPAVMSDTTAHRAFAGETGTTAQLYPIEDAETLAERLDALLGDPARLAAARQHAWQLGQQRHNWETESVALVETVRRSLGAQSRAREAA